jgi:hypothetical protein
MEKPYSKEFISDYEVQKTLGLTTPVNHAEDWYAADSNRRKRIAKIGASNAGDDFALCNLILDFDLIPYRKNNQIAHEVFENPSDVIFEIGELKFKKAAVDALKALPGWRSSEPTNLEHHIKRLKMRMDNILHLQQSRDQFALGPSILLRDALLEIENQIAAAKDRSEAVPDRIDTSIDPEVYGLIRQAIPEVQKIYDAVRSRVGFSGKNPEAMPDNWRQAALNRFNENKEVFLSSKKSIF